MIFQFTDGTKYLFSSEDQQCFLLNLTKVHEFWQDKFLAMPFLVSKNHATNTISGFSSHLVQITTAGEALQILRLGSRPWGSCVRLMQRWEMLYKLDFPGVCHHDTPVTCECPPNLGRIGHPFENSAPIYKRQPSGAKNTHQTNVHGGERDEILSLDILSLNESHPFLKSPRLNPGCGNRCFDIPKNSFKGVFDLKIHGELVWLYFLWPWNPNLMMFSG